MNRWSLKMFGLLSLLWIMTSCVRDADVEPMSVADADLTLTLSFNTGTRALKIGDPGTDHGEDTPDWKNLGVYLVYQDGRVLNFMLTKETFSSPQVFNVYPGIADVFVVALPEGQDVEICSTPDAVHKLKTLDVSTASVSDKIHYMRNIFSGMYSGFEIVKEAKNTVTVVCQRVVSKVDMQYDVQDGITNGKFVEAAMSSISFQGVPQAYLFPQQAGESFSATSEIVRLSGTISERNGRAYTYMFPGPASLNFDVTYSVAGNTSNTVNYNASFTNDLTALVWYKVNLVVRGETVNATGSQPITIQ